MNTPRLDPEESTAVLKGTLGQPERLQHGLVEDTEELLSISLVAM